MLGCEPSAPTYQSARIPARQHTYMHIYIYI